MYLTAIRGKRRWRVALERTPPAGVVVLTPDPAEADVALTSIVSRFCADIGDPLWQLELASHAATHAQRALLTAIVLADATREAPGPARLTVALPPGARPGTVRKAVARLLNGSSSGAADIGLQGAAAVMGTITLLALILRHGGSAPGALTLSPKGPLLALHGENQNRTRHLIGAVAREGGSVPLPLILLGRPRAAPSAALAALDPQGHLDTLEPIRPLALIPAIRSLPKGLIWAMRGLRAIQSSGIALTFEERLGMVYRGLQGAAHAAWWQSRPADSEQPMAVLFGHTGTADTSALEQAMQAGGTSTVHVSHGTNLGWAFTGLSTLGLFQSGADADLATELPAYGRSAHLPAPVPALARNQPGRWLVLTSYTHPLNPAYVENGPAADLAVLRMTAEAARMARPREIVWRPHPALFHVASETREALEKTAEAVGFTRWPADLHYAAVADFDTVFTTPSTALTDTLRSGTPPILVITAPLQQDLLYTSHPLIAETGEDIAACLSILSDPAKRAAAYETAWAALRPSAPLTLSGILDCLNKGDTAP